MTARAHRAAEVPSAPPRVFQRLWLGGALLGCGGPAGDPDAFRAEFAARWCEREEECALGAFERDFSSRDDCREDKQDDLDIPRWDDDCDLDPAGADGCLDYLRETDCAGWESKEIEQACEEVYPC